MSGTPTAALAATGYRWTVIDADGDTASLGFTIEVLAGAGTNAALRQAFAQSLAALAAKTLGGAQQTIGKRLDAAPGASSLTVAGRRVEFGAPDDRHRAETPEDVRIDWETLRRDSAFEMAFGEAGSGLEMTAWGRGGLMRFEAEQAGIDHRSRMETGWLGMDARVGDGLSWSASLATGVRADGAAMLADDLDYDEAGFGADEDRMALELEARYGFRLPAAHGLLSPLLRLSEEEGVRRKLEAGLAFEAARGRVDLELTGGHKARNGSADDNRLRLDLRLGF